MSHHWGCFIAHREVINLISDGKMKTRNKFISFSFKVFDYCSMLWNIKIMKDSWNFNFKLGSHVIFSLESKKLETHLVTCRSDR